MEKKTTINHQDYTYNLKTSKSDLVELEVNGKSFSFRKIKQTKNYLYLEDLTGGKIHKISTGKGHYLVENRDIFIESKNLSRRKKGGASHNDMASPMPGKILKVMVKVGDVVSEGDPLVVMEAMKMEHTIKASKDGKVNKLPYKAGEQVDGGVNLVNIE